MKSKIALFLVLLFLANTHYSFSQQYAYEYFRKAVYQRKVEKTERYVRQEFPVDVPASSLTDDPLFWYCFFKDRPTEDVYKIADLLLEHGANINRRNKHNENLGDLLLKKYFNQELGYVRFKSYWFKNYEKADFFNVYEYLISKGLDPGNNLLVTVEKGDFEMSEMLIKGGAQVNRPSTYSEITPLIKSVECNYIEMVRFLLDHDADIDMGDKNGVTPLIRSVESNHFEMVRFLLEHNADIDISDKNGVTPLIKSVKNENVEITKLLLDHNANANKSYKKGITPLMVSAGMGNNNIIRLLIENGAAIHQNDSMYKTAFTYAWEKGLKESMQLLMEYGSSPDSIPFLMSKYVEQAANGDLSKIKSGSTLPANTVLYSEFRNLFTMNSRSSKGICYSKTDNSERSLYSSESPRSTYTRLSNMVFNTSIVDYEKKHDLYIINLKDKLACYSTEWYRKISISDNPRIEYTLLQNPENTVYFVFSRERNFSKNTASVKSINEYTLTGDGYLIVDSCNVKTIYAFHAGDTTEWYYRQTEPCAVRGNFINESTGELIKNIVLIVGIEGQFYEERSNVFINGKFLLTDLPAGNYKLDIFKYMEEGIDIHLEEGQELILNFTVDLDENDRSVQNIELQK